MTDAWFELKPDDFLGRWYKEEYSTSTYSGSAEFVQGWMHRSLERSYDSHTYFPRTIELGANIGEHLPFIRHSFDEYFLSDIAIRQPLSETIAGRSDIRLLEADASRIPLPDSTFDRVLHTCLLHHVNDPEGVLIEIRRLLRIGGTADLFLPCDPGLAFRLSRWVGPERAARKRGLGAVKRMVDARDHRNHVGGLRRLIRHHFRNDLLIERSYPIAGLTWNTGLWFTYRVRKTH